MRVSSQAQLRRGVLLLGLFSSVNAADIASTKISEFDAQYGLKMMSVDQAYQLGFTGKGVVVGVVDSGIDSDHREFKGRLLPGYDFTTGQVILPNSGNTDNDIDEDGELDPHGTHVAGIIAANKDGRGMQGVAYDAQLFMVKMSDDLGESFVKAAGLGPRVVNLSLGLNDCDGGPDDQHRFCNVTEYTPAQVHANQEESSVLAGLRALHRSGALTVMATGNESQPSPDVLAGMSYVFPELKDAMVAVASVDPTGLIADYSNRCGVAAEWCLSAPGGTPENPIISAVPVDTYGALVGTSMAAPQVSGVAALVAEAFPYFSAHNLQQTLLTTATPLGDTSIYGWGLVNAGKAVRGPAQFIHTFEADTQGLNSTFSNAISGEGVLIKKGQGQLTLSGANTFALAKVEQGDLAITGHHEKAVEVATAGRLSGDGLIGQLHTAGVVAPGTAANTLGVLIITDAFTATNTATLEVSATAEGQSSALLVKGVSAIDGINIALKGDVFRPAVSYTLLTAEGGVSGSVGQVTGGQTTFLDIDVMQSAEQIQARIIRNGVRFDQFSYTDNQRALAQSLDRYSDASVEGLQPLYDVLLNNNGATLSTATQQLSGEVYSATQSALVQADRRWAQQVMRQSRQMPLSVEGATPAWVQINSTRNRLGAKAGVSSAKFNQSGIALGAGHALNSQWQLGAAFAYQDGKLTLNDLAETAKTNSYSAAVYAQSQWQLPQAGPRLHWLTGLSLSRHSVDYKRQLEIANQARSLDSKAHTTSYQLFTELGAQFMLVEPWSITPFLGAGWLQSRHGSAAEHGGYAALDRISDTVNTAYTQMGVRNRYEWVLTTGQEAVLYADLAWQHSLGKTQPQSAFVFANNKQVDFVSQGVGIAKNSVQIGLGASLALTKISHLALSYQGEFAGASSRQHGGMLSLQHSF